MTDREKYFVENNYASGLISEPQSLGALALISCCEYYNDKMKQSSAEGSKWIYSLTGKDAAQRGFFDDMLKAEKKGSNCASPVNWAFTDLGIIPHTTRFFGGADGSFAYFFDPRTRDLVESCCDVYELHDNPILFKTMFDEGKIQAGDVILTVHHTYIYRGDRTFFAAGHDGKWHTDPTAPSDDPKKCVFEDWVVPIEDNGNYTKCKVHYLIRFKKDYIPVCFRNKQGELEINPMSIPW